MFYSRTKKNALNEYESARKKYDSTYKTLETLCSSLYSKRTSTVSVVKNIGELINSIANTPKSFEAGLVKISTSKAKFKETEEYAQEAAKTLKNSSFGAAAGVAGGAAVASLAPTAAMWVATTFGTASTGTAISTLSGAALTKAALAWLGGGALAAGGGGIAAGNALLALAGPIGWGIAGLSTATSLGFVAKKNKKIADEAIQATKTIREAHSVISEQVAKVRTLHNKTESLLTKVKMSYHDLKKLNGQDYLEMSEEEQLSLGTLVNNAASLAVLLNETIQ